MLFNSHLYLFLFLPLVVAGYFLLSSRNRFRAAQVWLFLASLFFYGYWNPKYVGLILASIVVNYAVASVLYQSRRRVALALGVVFNVALLGYYKYANFFVDNLNLLLGTEYTLQRIVLPLAISFFTFQQIAFLVDVSKGEVQRVSFFNYCIFITFFPQLVAGPIVHHSEMMPQFADRARQRIDYRNIVFGLHLFAIGLFKKCVLADSFGGFASPWFADPATLNTWTAWAAALGYTFQLYFDFSGYMDMARGSASMLNIGLPRNFDSPYKSTSILEFWRRWHMTLGRFLREYVYIPLGGNRRGQGRTYANLFLTFFIGGIWHGAGWTFVLWGALHGAGCVVNRAWQRHGFSLPRGVGGVLTFLFVVVGWVYFRAADVTTAHAILWRMFTLSTVQTVNFYHAAMLALGLVVVFFFRNSNTLAQEEYSAFRALRVACVLFCGLFVLEVRQASEFLYFQF